MKNKYKDILDLIKGNSENRGTSSISTYDEFELIVDELISSESILIITGFCIKSMGVGETDGPLGAGALAYTLSKLGKKVGIVTDQYSIVFIRQIVKKLELDVEIFEVGGEIEEAQDIIQNFNPTHIIAIERPGRAIDGHYYSMSGVEIDEIIIDTDHFLSLPERSNIKTICIGDGGNELGMGKIKDMIMKYVPQGNKIAASLPADYVLMSGISNYGGYGVSAGIACKSKDLDLIYKPEVERMLLQEVVKLGSVDGVTKENIQSVDGVNIDDYIEVYSQIYEFVRRK